MEVMSAKSHDSTESLLTSQASISRPTSRPGSKHGTRLSSANSSLRLQAGGGSVVSVTSISPVPPAHLRPVVKSAVRRWKRTHETEMFDRLMAAKDTRRAKDKLTREQMSRLARRIPVDLLAREWLNKERATIEAREFLIENILPSLILGLQKLLMEVLRRDIADKEEVEPTFNPINFIAQYLMRNNPKFSNFSEASPYIRGIRQVSEELRQEIYQFNDNKLAKLKAEARRRREEKEAADLKKKTENDRRLNLLMEVFDKFLNDAEVKVDRSIVTSSVSSFSDIIQQLPEEIRDKLAIEIDFDVAEKATSKIGRKEFSSTIMSYAEPMDGELFNQLAEHLNQCAVVYRSTAANAERKYLLSNLFVSCDLDEIGTLDRPRIIELFKKFYDNASESVQKLLRNPEQFPIRDVHEDLGELVESQSMLRKSKSGDVHSGEGEPKEVVDMPLTTLEGVSEPQNVMQEKYEEPEDEKEAEEPVTESKEQTSEEQPADDNVKKEDSVSGKEDTEPAAPQDDSTVRAPEEDVKAPEEDVKVAEDTNQSNLPEGEPTVEERKESTAREELVREATGDSSAKSTTSKKSTVSAVSPIGGEEEDSAVVPAAEGEPETTVPLQGLLKEKSVVKSELGRSTSGVAFAKGTTFNRDTTGLSMRSEMTARSQSSVYDNKFLDEPQFIRLTENFLGDGTGELGVIDQLADYVRDGYQETDDERLVRMQEAHRLAMAERRKQLMNSLFELWDNEGSGYVEVNQVETVVEKFKNGALKKGGSSAKRLLRQNSRFHDNRLTKAEFRTFLTSTLTRARKEGDTEALIEFLVLNVERNHVEKARGEARKKFLHQIILAGRTSSANLEPVYRAAFQALYKDAEVHGDRKTVSSNIALLEKNTGSPDKGDMMLKYVAATLDDAPFILGKLLYKIGPGISFEVVESGVPVHVARASTNKNIVFWNPNRKEDHKNGAVVIVPLKDSRKRVFGVIGVDTLNDPRSSTSFFAAHEIQFFQGVSKSLSIAYHFVDTQRKALRVGESALTWMVRRIEQVTGATYYLKENDPSLTSTVVQDFALRRMFLINSRGDLTRFPLAPRFEREDNMFRSYLFHAVDTSAAVVADAYGERHLAMPIRDLEGRAIIVIDISIGGGKELSPEDRAEVGRIVALLQMGFLELMRAAQGEGDLDEEDSDLTNKAEEMFDQMMLNDLKRNLVQLDAQSYAELRSYPDPPPIVHLIIQATLAFFYTDRALRGDFEVWETCKPLIGVDLGKRVVDYNPHLQAGSVPIEFINSLIQQIPINTVSKQGSLPAQYLFNWVFVCVTLVEHTLKMKENKKLDDSAKTPQ